MISGAKAQIAIKIFGDDLNTLYRLGNSVKGSISSIPGVVDVNVEQQVARPQLHISPRRDLLARFGITMEQFAKFVEVTLSGEVVSQVYENGLPYDLTLRLAEAEETSRKLTKKEVFDELMKQKEVKAFVESMGLELT